MRATSANTHPCLLDQIPEDKPHCRTTHHPRPETQVCALLQSCWRIDRLQGTTRYHSEHVNAKEALCSLSGNHSLLQRTIVTNAAPSATPTSELTCEWLQMQKLSNSNRNHTVGEYACILHTWTLHVKHWWQDAQFLYLVHSHNVPSEECTSGSGWFSVHLYMGLLFHTSLASCVFASR